MLLWRHYRCDDVSKVRDKKPRKKIFGNWPKRTGRYSTLILVDNYYDYDNCILTTVFVFCIRSLQPSSIEDLSHTRFLPFSLQIYSSSECILRLLWSSKGSYPKYNACLWLRICFCSVIGCEGKEVLQRKKMFFENPFLTHFMKY